ncbi:MAG: glycogen/starch/alpha-glucan phosphorylase [Lachnospiraceae bacterium]|nr:glycogen/starch/alpha-glucan phosphorylase [Lachnospiraceae bacterium]
MAKHTSLQRDILIMHLEEQLEDCAKERYHKRLKQLSVRQVYRVLVQVVNDLLASSEPCAGEKKIYYISMEFLIGKLLSNNLINLRIYDDVARILKKNGFDLADIEEEEAEPALGNGGLGRLAACFLDSITTLHLPGEGIGLAWHYGLFRQVFSSNLQRAKKDVWMSDDTFLIRTDTTFDVHFGKKKVTARLYNLPVTGYDSGVNQLRLFDLETVDESLVTSGIRFDKKAVRNNLTLFLYPDDSDEDGNLLRIYQEYFLSSCAAQLILSQIREKQYDLHRLPDYAQIQINDTHPTLVIPELIRILVEDKAFSMDDAIDTVTKVCSYTNHTILSEALETWPLSYLRRVVPQLIPYIRELDARIAKKCPERSVQIIDSKKKVHMAHIDIHYSHSVNGVAALHTEILKTTELHDFYKLYPSRFNNKTNGITFRRWLMLCNRPLSDYLTTMIGSGFKKKASQLTRLLRYSDDEEVLDALDEIKRYNKKRLAEYILEKEGVVIDPDAIFDIQAKRLHEYKRQQMNALYIIHKYLEIRRGKKPARPVVYIFGAKAAPAYVIAQDIIHLLLVLQQLINNDKKVSKYMKIIMVENYNVTYAEKLIPACDVSEQISLASKEASGTGNMKFMLNGAVTIGTEDGANVEIHHLVGDDNIYIFGERAEKVIEHYAKADYVSADYYKKSKVIREAVDFIVSDKCMKIGHRRNLTRLHKELLQKDWFMTLLDLEDYIRTKDRMFEDYENRDKWKRMMLVNIAKAGFFSSDRTIAEYNRDIWRL